MINHEITELAKIYGIEISNVESGKGGLFYTDSQGNKEILDTIFDSNDYIVSKNETISYLKKCSTYSTYSQEESLRANAA